MNQNNMTSLLTLLIGNDDDDDNYDDDDDDNDDGNNDDDKDDKKKRQDDLNECSPHSHRHDDDRRQLHRVWRWLDYAGEVNTYCDDPDP